MSVFCEKYSTGAHYSKLKKIKTQEIYTLYNKNIVFKEDELLFNEKITSDYPEDTIILEAEPNYQCEKIVVKNLYDLKKIIKKYKVIAVDEEFRSLIASMISCEYYEEMLFKDSFEGIMWQKIVNLNNEFASAEDLDKIEFLQSIKCNKNNVFPYLKHSYLKYNELLNKIKQYFSNKEYSRIYKIFTNKEPFYNFNIENFQSDLKKIYLKFNVGEKVLISKELSHCFNKEKVVYIGASACKNIDLHIIYEISYQIYPSWEEKKVELEFNSEYEVKLYDMKEFDKLRILNLGVKNDEKNLYSAIKKFAINEMKARVNNNKYENEWKEFLKCSGLNYMKILNKAEVLISNFFKLYEKSDCSFDYVIANDVKVGFFQKIAGEIKIIDFFWTMPVADDQFLKIEKIKEKFKDEIIDYYFISTEKIKKIDLSKIKKKEYVLKKQQNLYYWQKDVVYKKNS